MKVTDPDGQVWRVSRRWVPWRQRLRDVRDLAEETAWSAREPADLVVWVIVLVISVVAPIVFSLLFLPLEFVAVVMVLPLAVIGRVVFGRKWHVELRRGWRPWTEVEAGRWSDATRRIAQLADAVRRGEIPTRTLGADPPA